MWFDEAGEVVEMFKNSFPFSFLFFVPIFILISPVSPVAAAHEFTVYRMQQFELHGSAYGCKNAIVNFEARPVDAQIYTRRCVIAKLKELTVAKYKELMNQAAGALVVILPRSLQELTEEDRTHLVELEREMLSEETQVPVFFSQENSELAEIHKEVVNSATTDSAGSAAEAMLKSASATGFQIVIGNQQAKAMQDFQIANIQGKLTGQGVEEQLPTVAFVAHYDSMGVAPAMSFGSDSNGSGVVALLELARIFSKLYTNSRTHAKFNLLFLLSGAGKLNFQGTRRWIDDQLDSDSSLLVDVAYVLCLDSLGKGNNLHLHVSKPPKEGSAGDVLLKNLEEVAKEFYPEMEFSMMHKKINLAEDLLAWEHERFSLRKLPAFSLSHHENHAQPERTSVLDTSDTVESEVLVRNIKVIAEAVARHVFNMSAQTSSEVFTSGLSVEKDAVSSWVEVLSSQPRSVQLLTKDGSVVSTLEHALNRHLKDVRKTTFKADKRDPEFVLYDGTEYTMSAYSVKPAVFDLFLAVGIAAYLAAMYLITQNFNIVYSTMRKFMGPMKVKGQ